MIAFSPTASGWPNDDYYSTHVFDSPTFVNFFKFLHEQLASLPLLDGDIDFTEVVNAVGRNSIGLRAVLKGGFGGAAPSVEVWGENESGQQLNSAFKFSDYNVGTLAERTDAWLHAAYDRALEMQTLLNMPTIISVAPVIKVETHEPLFVVDENEVL